MPFSKGFLKIQESWALETKEFILSKSSHYPEISVLGLENVAEELIFLLL